jgi:hypothetical protein
MTTEAIKPNLTRTDLFQCGWNKCTAILEEKSWTTYRQGGWVFNNDSNAHGPYRMFKKQIGVSTSDVVYSIYENRWSKELSQDEAHIIEDLYENEIEKSHGIPKPKMIFLYNGLIESREQLLQIMVDLDICTQEYMDYKMEHNFDIGDDVCIMELTGIITKVIITKDAKYYDIDIPGMLNGEGHYVTLHEIDSELVTRAGRY